MSEAERSMDTVCDNVNKVLQSNQELSMRLRNMEDILTRRIPPTTALSVSTPGGQTSVGAEQETQSDTLDLSSASIRSASTTSDPTQDTHEHLAERPDESVEEQPRVSAFEELLHRSHVYRHAASSHSESSLLDDGRSSLALSICSSMTLGDISKVSVYALPVYATEISNPECYHFARPTTFIEKRQGPSTPIAQKRSEQKKLLVQWWKTFNQSPGKQVNIPVEQADTRIFGGQLQTSIRFANVAISLLSEDGKSYTYGYIPFIVAKCAVKLKEEGE